MKQPVEIKAQVEKYFAELFSSVDRRIETAKEHMRKDKTDGSKEHFAHWKCILESYTIFGKILEEVERWVLEVVEMQDTIKEANKVKIEALEKAVLTGKFCSLCKFRKNLYKHFPCNNCCVFIEVAYKRHFWQFDEAIFIEGEKNENF